MRRREYAAGTRVMPAGDARGSRGRGKMGVVITTASAVPAAAKPLRASKTPASSSTTPLGLRFSLGLLLGLLPLLLQAAQFAYLGASDGTSAWLRHSAYRALVAGWSGLIAGLIEVPCLMWMRTVMNHQYRHGGSMVGTLQKLYAEGGVARLYSGVTLTLVHTSLVRFGDTAANAGVDALLSGVPLALRTAASTATSVAFRVLVSPVDTLKTTAQVEGKAALALLRAKARRDGVGVLWHGCNMAALASAVGTYPWFATFNALDSALPLPPPDAWALPLLRSALLGLSAACASDCCSNALRVLKTARQTAPTSISYAEAARQVLEKEGPRGLLCRGLSTRLLVNGVQCSLFAVAWKLLQARMDG